MTEQVGATVSSGPGAVGRLRDVVRRELERSRVPGAAVAVVSGGQVVLAEGFGVRNVDDRRPVTPSTLFAIASCTKAMTATLIGGLVDEERLSWDAPARDVLPALRLADPTAGEQITLRDMLSHRSGLPRHDLIWFGNPALSRPDLVSSLAHLAPSTSLRQLWQYNNLMYVAAGHLAEQVLGSPWEDALTARVLEPLGMSSTKPSMAAARRVRSRSAGHVITDAGVATIPLDATDACGPAGSVSSTLDDLVRWLQWNLSGTGADRRTGSRLPTAATLAELHRPTAVLPAPMVSWPEISSRGYGLGWKLDTYRGHRLVSHGGNLSGFSSMVSFLPDDDIGVVVLANLQVTPFRDIVPFAVFDELLELDPVPWGERLRATTSVLMDGPGLASDHRVAAGTARPGLRPPAEYVGTYSHPGYGELSVQRSGRALGATLHELALTVHPVGHEAVELREGTLDVRLPAKFEADFTGTITGISVLMEESVPPVHFARIPDAAPATAISRIVGDYVCGPLVVSVQEVEGAATLAIGELPAVRLHHRTALEFSLAGRPHAIAEFLAEGRRRADELVLFPHGRFVRSS